MREKFLEMKTPWVRIASSVRGFIISEIRSMFEMMNPRTLEAMRTQGSRRSLMKYILRCLALSLLTVPSLLSLPPVAGTEIKNKEEAVASIEKRKAEMIKLSDQIWAYAETALREHKSS